MFVDADEETGDFNSHARVGRDHGRCFQKPDVENFNSHARVGRDRRIF